MRSKVYSPEARRRRGQRCSTWTLEEPRGRKTTTARVQINTVQTSWCMVVQDQVRPIRVRSISGDWTISLRYIKAHVCTQTENPQQVFLSFGIETSSKRISPGIAGRAIEVTELVTLAESRKVLLEHTSGIVLGKDPLRRRHMSLGLLHTIVQVLLLRHRLRADV
jgi:hypothetical protein